MTTVEKEAWRAAKAEKQAARRSEAAAKAARLAAAAAPGAPVPHVIIDLNPAYDALMTPRERTSLASQLRACYASNAASPHPLKLTFAGFSPAWEAALGGAASGLHAWRVGRTGADYLGAAAAASAAVESGGEAGPPPPPSKIVYLSADAPAEVDRLEPGTAYVIGGLVDRNRHKGIAARRAGEAASEAATASTSASVSAARLPIGPYLAKAASAVLTVDQVARLLVLWWAAQAAAGKGEADGDPSSWWAAAVEAAVPPRKRRGGDGGEEEGGSEEGG